MKIAPLFKRYKIFILIFLPFQLFATEQQNSLEQACLKVHNKWLKEAFQLTRNCVGFSAPVSARAYSYIVVGMYESTVEILPTMQTLSNQLNGYERTVWLKEDNELNWAIVSNSVNYEMINYFYRNMPPFNKKEVEKIFTEFQNEFCTNSSSQEIELSLEYGKKIASEIIAWSVEDGMDNGFNLNYPENFKPKPCESCWTKTTPGYFNALQPYWGENRTFLKRNDDLFAACLPNEYSKDTSSAFYKDAFHLWETAKNAFPEHEIIAEYWDDSPGYSGTPSGHFFMLAQDLAIHENLTLDQSLELYVKLGIALNEAFIYCWKLKYTFNYVRPISYIQRTIDSHFNTYIATPSFPEFPSGHSFQSGAGTEVLKSMFTDNLSFIDSTNCQRSDINGSPRSFSSFTELANEISTSRYYGGIHFNYTLEISLDYGKKLGEYVLNEIKCRK